MKKFSLLLCCFVALLVSQKVMADAVLSDGNQTLTITTSAAGQVSGMVAGLSTEQKAAITKIVLIGEFNSSDLEVIKTNGDDYSVVTTVDMSQAKFLRAIDSSSPHFLFHSTAGTLPYDITGRKAYANVGNNLYQLSVNTPKVWDPTNEVNYSNFIYPSYDALLAADLTDKSPDWNTKARVGKTFQYYQVINNISGTWQRKLGVEINNSTYSSDVNSAISTALSNVASGVTSKTMYIYFQSVDDDGDEDHDDYYWKFIDIEDATKGLAWDEDLNGDPDGVNADINGLVRPNDYKDKFIHFTYVYSKINWQTSGTYINDNDIRTKVNSSVAKKLYSLNGITNKNIVVYFNCKKNDNDDNYQWQYVGVYDEGVKPYQNLGEAHDINGDTEVESLENINNLPNVSGHENDYVYFTYEYNTEKAWGTPTDSEPSGVTIINANYDVTERSGHLNEYEYGDWVKMPSEYDYYNLIWGTPVRSWNGPIEYNDADQRTISHIYSTPEAMEADKINANNGDYAIVQGPATEQVYDGSQWINYTSSTELIDYSQMQFNKWSNTLQTAILPNNVSVASCPVDLFKGCHQLTTVTHNNQSAAISVVGTSANTMVTVNSTGEAGLFRLLLNSDAKLTQSDQAERFAEGTTFKFTSPCAPSAQDLAALAGSGQYANHNKFYVDLFLLSSDEATTGAAVSGAIDIMRTNNWQYKGLLLPGNLSSATTQYIKDRDEDGSKLSTCSEFIGYNKSLNTVTTMHIYGTSGSSDYQARFTKLKSMMNAHTVIASTTTSYVVSTNSQTAIDISSLGSGANTVEIVNDDMVNPVSGAKADIYVTLKEAGQFADVAAATGITGTPTEKLSITGNVYAADIAVVNGFGDGNGPRVLDLQGVVPTATGETAFDDKAMLESLTNDEIQFIVLKGVKSKEVVCDANYSASMTSLKAVISSESYDATDCPKPKLVAYLKVPGSLAEARCLATGNSSENQFNPTPQQLTSVTLAGRLRNTDISTPNANGLANEKGTIQTLDLGDAVFVDGNNVITPTEMNFNGAGFSGNVTGETPEIVLTKVVLPTHEDMDELSNNCFYEMKSLKELCIPFNYKVIHSGALNETDLDHITTTSGYNGVLVDNGPKTYTLSANLEQIGDEPANKGTELNGTYPVFPKNKGVTDLYSLATKVPKCYKDAFGADMTNGYGGQDQSKVYCRERYFNNGDANKAFTILHIPSLESFNSATTDKESNYATMVKNYTDDTKKYTKLDQTGAVDGNGNPLRWPTHLEMLRVYKQASSGLLWSSWSEGTDTDEHGFKVKDGATGSEPQQDVTTSFYDYIGWHQIVLCVSSNVTPTETPNENKEIVREFTQPGWYTFCIPYNLTYSQVLKMMGVPASDTEYDSKTGLKVINKVGTTTVEENKMPDIRQLSKVVRQAGDETHNNKVIFRLTDNLFQGSKTATSTSKETHYLDFADADGYHSSENEVSAGSGDDPICLVGGRPYYIKPYLPDGVTPSKSNLGKYIMTHYADELGLQHSCVDNGPEFCEQLEIFTYDNRNVSGINSSADDNTKNTMRFAKPYENHKVQAVISSASDAGQLTYEVKENGVTKTYRYYYTMVGQFWEQDLPQYCFYMSGQTWYRYPELKGYKWAPYKCIIMATPEEVTKSNVSESDIHDAINTAYNKASIETTTTTTTTATTAATTTNVTSDQKPASTPTSWTGWEAYYSSTWNHFGGGYRNFSGCYFPMNMPGTTNWLLNPFSLCFFGRNDFSFVNDKSVGAYKGSSTRYIFSFGDDEDIVDIDGQTNDATYIETLDGVPQFTTGELKVYSLSGQYMGKTTEGLPRGIYIVGGRKVVVD